jgi:MFS family permease
MSESGLIDKITVGTGRLAAAWRQGPLAVPAYRLLVGGQVTSTIGDCCYTVALPWLVLSSHGGPVLLGVVLGCYGVTRTVFIPVGGVLADKMGSRALMLVTDTVRCLVVTALAVLAARHSATVTGLGPIAALMGAGEGIFLPASYAIMPSLLDADRLAAGNALSTAITQGGLLVGPALGGALVATGTTEAFAADAVSFAVSALTLALIPSRASHRQVEQPAAAAGRPKAEGILAFLRRSRILQLIVVAALTANLAIGGISGVALPALAHARFGAGGYGALLVCFAAGGIAGTVVAARTRGLRRPAVFASVVFVVMAVAMAGVPFLGGLAGASAALALFGACNSLGNLIVITKLQMWAPPQLIGRLTSVLMVCVLGSYPLSVAITGVLVRHLGPAPFFPIAAAPVIIAILWGLTQREWRAFGAPDQADE